jgi:hypothetical protein
MHAYVHIYDSRVISVDVCEVQKHKCFFAFFLAFLHSDTMNDEQLSRALSKRERKRKVCDYIALLNNVSTIWISIFVVAVH